MQTNMVAVGQLIAGNWSHQIDRGRQLVAKKIRSRQFVARTIHCDAILDAANNTQ